MKSRRLIAAFSYVLFLLSFACHQDAGAKRGNMVPNPHIEEELAPVIAIEVDETFRLSEPLKFDWRISNSGSKPVYIFSTLLEPQNNGFAELSIDTKDRILGVGFLRSITAVGFPPYSFPKLQFKQIESGQSLSGQFISDGPIAHFKDYRLVGTKLDEIRLMPGAWKLRATVAYGYEVGSVQKAVKESMNAGQEHSMNAVVRWQRVEHSIPTAITIQK
jgi:hypothetical protein